MPIKATFTKGDDSNASGNTLYQNIYHINKIRLQLSDVTYKR